jgi:hypothetical protein
MILAAPELYVRQALLLGSDLVGDLAISRQAVSRAETVTPKLCTQPVARPHLMRSD